MAKKKTSAANARNTLKATQTVRRIVDHHFGPDVSARRSVKKKPVKVVPLSGGLSNLVFLVDYGGTEYVVRLGTQPEKTAVFMKEQWAIEKARQAGVPTPEILEAGSEASPVPYMILRRNEGCQATFHEERASIVAELGRYAAVINSIPTTGFGSTFEWSANQLSYNKTWKEFLEKELRSEEKIEILERHRIVQPANARELRKALESAAGRDRRPGLNHGDLRLKNVLVNSKGQICCILDWEKCMSNLAPEWDLAIALHDLSIDEKQEFLDGYGLTGKQVCAISPALKALNIVNYATAVQSAATSKDRAELEKYRARLSGALDLYSQ